MQRYYNAGDNWTDSNRLKELYMMKFSRPTAIIAMFSLMALPVLAELTDYQQGVYDGLRAGGQIGYLLGAAPYDATAAQQYNITVNQYNAWLQSVFGGNQTAINNFWMNPLSGQTTVGGHQAYSVANSTKPQTGVQIELIPQTGVQIKPIPQTKIQIAPIPKTGIQISPIPRIGP
jgi:hypothetical protein